MRQTAKVMASKGHTEYARRAICDIISPNPHCEVLVDGGAGAHAGRTPDAQRVPVRQLRLGWAHAALPCGSGARMRGCGRAWARAIRRRHGVTALRAALIPAQPYCLLIMF